MTNEDKKEWLRRHKKCRNKIKDKEYQIIELETEKVNITSFLSDMPKGSTHQYIDDLIILRMDRINKINNEIKHLETVCDEIECAISTIDDYSAERIMRLRYVEGLGWEGVCERTGYEWAQVHRHHSEGLKYIEI